MLHSHIPIMFTLHVCAMFSHGEHWCASPCSCSPTRQPGAYEWWNHEGVCNYCLRLSAIQIPDGNNVINLNGTRVTCSFVTSPLITSCFSSTCAWHLALYLGLPYFQFLRLQAINWSQGRLGNKTTWRCHTYLPKASEVQASLYLGHFRWPQWRFNRMKIS